MDLEEWEFLSDDVFVDQVHQQDGNGNGKRVISRETLPLYSGSMIDMNYFHNFIDPHRKTQIGVSPNLVIPVPVEFDSPTMESAKSSPTADLVVKEMASPENPNKVGWLDPQGDKETVSSQVFFKKTRENEFADMKLDSPKSTNRGFYPQIDLGKPQFEEKDEGFDGEDAGKKNFSKGFKSDVGVLDSEENFTDPDHKEWENEDSHGGLNIWKIGMTGIGALCSFGVACATICVIALGSSHREKHHHQKLHFQMYTDDKGINEVVHHAAKLNEAISAVRGAPLSRAQITMGGYFEGL